MSQKVGFSAIMLCTACGGALLKNRTRFLLYFLNGCRYHKYFNQFQFQILIRLSTQKFKKKLMKNNEFEKTKISYIFVTIAEKIHAKSFFFENYEESLTKISDRSEKILSLVVKGLCRVSCFK